MLTVKEWMELVDYRITEGSDYWPEGNLGGRQLYSLDSWNGDHNGWSFCIGFDPKDQRVYIVEACDYKHGRAYRRADPDLELDKEAWDDVDYIDLDTDDDFIQKALAIKSGEDYDTRVEVPLTLPDDALFELMKQAHEQDITLNQLVENILRKFIDQEKTKAYLSDNEYWDKLAEESLQDCDDWEEQGVWTDFSDDDSNEWEDDIIEDEPPKKKKKKKSK